MTQFGAKRGDEALIAALAGGASQQAASIQTRLSRRTIVRRLADPAFRAALQRARAELVEAATRRLAAGATIAADQLVALAEGATSESVRHSAARSVLDLVLKARELDAFEERLSRMEAVFRAD